MFTVRAQGFEGVGFIFGGQADHHADTTVESSEHLMVIDSTLILQPGKYFGALPAAEVNDGAATSGQYSRKVFR